MNNSASNIVIGNPGESESVRKFVDGSRRAVSRLRSAAIGLGTYHPGWRWSVHAGPQTGKASENHIGYILSGQMLIRDSGGTEKRVGPGDAFEVGPGHDAWVTGAEPCIALDFIPIQQAR